MIKISQLLLFSIVLISCSKIEEDITNTQEEQETELEQDSFGSYRYFLWRIFLNNNQQFDFIGTQQDPYRYPKHNGQNFDSDHEGIGGIRSDEVLNNLDTVLNSIESPDIALIGIGINDVLQGYSANFIGSNLEEIINQLQENNPNITIIVEQIAGLGIEFNNPQMEETIEHYNSLVATICANSTNSSSTVIPVNIYDDFTDDFFSDGLHYNLQGSMYVAQKYFSKIESFLNPSLNLKILPIGDSRVVGYRVNSN